MLPPAWSILPVLLSLLNFGALSQPLRAAPGWARLLLAGGDAPHPPLTAPDVLWVVVLSLVNPHQPADWELCGDREWFSYPPSSKPGTWQALKNVLVSE